jgi:ribonuclease III
MPFPRIESALGHQFANPELLRTALTHRSFGSPNNERLEFLGDGVLDFVIADQLFSHFPDLPEGDLSRLRANLVRQDSLHRVAVSLGLGDFLLLGEGELRSGGRQRPSILADCFEALLGAVYRDGGYAAVEAVIVRHFRTQIAALQPGQGMKDAKTQLQEWLQARHFALPRYLLQEAQGQAHAQQFMVACEIAQPSLRTLGSGGSRRIAEQAAAQQALEALQG